MKALTFKLKLLQPLLIGQLGAGEENSAITFDYIAGSTVRGAIIGRYLQEAGDFDLANLPADSEIRRLFFDGTVTYLNAYLQDKDGQRTLPVPRSWKGEKDESDSAYGTIIDAALAGTVELAEPKSIPAHLYCQANFLEIADDDDFESRTETILYSPRRHVGLHNASEQRYLKQERDSVVFRYEALAADQTFCGAILSEDENLLAQLRVLLEPPDLFLGRSRSAGYGHTAIVEVTFVDEWQEYRKPEPNNEPDVITLTLLSDTILRDKNGHYTADLSTIPAIKALEIKKERFVATGLTGGFNRKWGLPLPQVPVIQAGSVWTFARSAETEAVLQGLAATGIGERRGEGFGRVAVNWQQFPQIEKRPLPVNRQLATAITLNSTAKDLAQQMVKRLYCQQLDRKLLNVLASGLTIRAAPENTQLSRLRVVARRAWHENRPELVEHFLSNMKPLARNQYLQAQIGDKSLLQWLQDGWQGDKLWSDYFYMSTTSLPQIGNIQMAEVDAIKLEYKARLIDGLCNKTIKERRAEMLQSSEQLANTRQTREGTR